MMAEQIPYCIVINTINRLASSGFQEIGRISGIMGELEKLKEIIESIKVVLLDAEEKQQESHGVRNWIKKMKIVLHEADDLFDDFVIETFQHEVNDHGEKVRKVRSFLSSSDQLAFSSEIAYKIEAIQKKFNDVAKDMPNLNFHQREMGIRQNESGETEIGSLMSESNILDGSFWASCEDKESIMPVLKLGYNSLSPELRQCFAYCSLYSKGQKIEKEELIQLWMAQGYVDCTSDKKHIEMQDIGEEYINILLKRSFFQDVEMNEWGDIACFKLHPLMHDLAQLVAGSDCYVDSEGMIVGSPMHISFASNVSRSSDTLDGKRWRPICRRVSNFVRSLDTLDTKCLRSILRLDQGKLLIVNNLSAISNFTCLRAFSLSFSSLTELPNSFGELKHLRYLDLSHCNRLTSLPETISNLVFLQTLKLSYCWRLDGSVEGITNLISLRHLVVDRCKAFEYGIPVSFGELKSLQQLPIIYVGDGDNPERRDGKLNELKGLSNLRGHLTIENLHLVNDAALESEEVNLKEKKYLSSLSLNWRRDSNKGCQNSNALQLLENLCPHQNLKIFTMYGYPGVRLSSWISSLANVVKITIMSCDNCQHLPPLEHLPSLKYLKIWQMDALEYLHYEWPQRKVPSSSTSSSLPMPTGPTPYSFFPSLERLDIRRCPSLKGWRRIPAGVNETYIVKHEHQNQNQQQEEYLSLPPFPCLSYLSISICPNLACMPTYPFVEKFDLRFSSNMKPFTDTLEMKTKNVASTTEDENESEPFAMMSNWCKSPSSTPLSTLKSLAIQNIDIEALPEEWMKNLTSLKSLSIYQFPRLAPMFRYMRHLHSPLEKLEIWWVDNFDMSNYDDEIEDVGISTQCQVLRCLCSLQTIVIDSCQHLRALPKWICSLTSIQHMTISRCSNLESLPEGMHGLTNLQKLLIIGCPLLKNRCQRESGADWPKISHVPDIIYRW